MILDKLLEFDPAGTAITATAVSTNIFDLHGSTLLPGSSSTSKPGRDMGIGDGAGYTPKLMVLCLATFTAAGAATLNVQFQGAPDNGSGAPGTWTTYAETGTIAVANITAGVRLFDIDVPRPVPGAALPRFYRLNYVVATGPFTAGTVQAEMVLTRDDLVSYPSGFTVAN